MCPFGQPILLCRAAGHPQRGIKQREYRWLGDAIVAIPAVAVITYQANLTEGGELL